MPAKKGRKKVVKEPPVNVEPDLDVPLPDTNTNEQYPFESKPAILNEKEVERRITAVQALCEAETENLLSRLRLLRSYFQSEQLQNPVLHFFRDNLPNLSVKRNEKYKIFELERNNISITLNNAAGRDVLASFENPTTTCASAGGLFTLDSAKQNILRAASLQIPNFSLDELENQYPGFINSLHTPGGNCPRLSVGMTPKTRRQPKRGEMLLSVHGSPLGLYQEENLEAIHEFGDGYPDTTNGKK